MTLTIAGYQGTKCNDKPPAIMTLLWGVDHNEKVSFIAHNTRLDQTDDTPSIISLPMRGVKAEWNEFDQAKEEVLATKAIVQIMHHYTGHDFESHFKGKGPKVLTHKSTALFSGPDKGQQVICLSAFLGKFDNGLPEILTSDQGGTYPAIMNEDNKHIADEDRKNTAWVSYEDVMTNLVSTATNQLQDLPASAFYAPYETPFRVNKKLIESQPTDTTRISASLVHVLETFNETVLFPQWLEQESSAPSETRRWVTAQNIYQAGKELG